MDFELTDEQVICATRFANCSLATMTGGPAQGHRHRTRLERDVGKLAELAYSA